MITNSLCTPDHTNILDFIHSNIDQNNHIHARLPDGAHELNQRKPTSVSRHC